MFNNLRSKYLVKLRQFSNRPLGPPDRTIQFTKYVDNHQATLPNTTAMLCGNLRNDRLPNLGKIFCDPSNSPFINNIDIFNEKHPPFISPFKHDNYVYVFKNFSDKCDRPRPPPKRPCKKDNVVKTYGDDCPKCPRRSKPTCDRCGPKKRNPCTIGAISGGPGQVGNSAKFFQTLESEYTNDFVKYRLENKPILLCPDTEVVCCNIAIYE